MARQPTVVPRPGGWIREHNEWEHRLFAVIMVAGVALLLMVLFTDRGLSQWDVGGSRLYLLSSIIQGLAAILALLVTLSLIARSSLPEPILPGSSDSVSPTSGSGPLCLSTW